MHTRRLVKRSVIGSRVYAPGLTGDAAPLTGVIQAVKQDNRDASTGHRRNVYTVLMQDGSLDDYSEEEIAQMTAKAPLKSSLKVCVCVCGQLGLLLSCCLSHTVHAWRGCLFNGPNQWCSLAFCSEYTVLFSPPSLIRTHPRATPHGTTTLTNA